MKKLYMIEYCYGGDDNTDWYWADNEKDATNCLYEAHEIEPNDTAMRIYQRYLVDEAIMKSEIIETTTRYLIKPLKK
jgi:hypothetical protein